jgi:hypothetical protein
VSKSLLKLVFVTKIGNGKGGAASCRKVGSKERSVSFNGVVFIDGFLLGFSESIGNGEGYRVRGAKFESI